jgi:hypothetical protein
MIPDGLKDQFEFYRKWFRTLLIKEFLNLPSDYQNQFIRMVKKFLEDCIKIQEEGKIVKEKLIELTIVDKFLNNHGDVPWTMYCTSPEFKHKVEIPLFKNYPELEIGTKLHRTIFSIDGKTWYSSKEELIRKTQP